MDAVYVFVCVFPRSVFSPGTYWLLWGICICTSCLGCLVGCYAVIVLMFPICVEVRRACYGVLEVSTLPSPLPCWCFVFSRR
jgi:hypothetical protein